MRSKFYIVTINADKFNPDLEFHKGLTETKGIEAWWHHFYSTYIIKVSNSVKAKDIVNVVRRIAPQKRSFIAEINLNNAGGILPQTAWNWIRNHQISESSLKG